MKTPSFWYKPAGLRAKLLSPLGFLYGKAGRMRRAYSKPYISKVPLICIGNLTAGGAGKTPTALALVSLIKEQDPNANPVFVTRGYGGSREGPLRVKRYHTAQGVGDEALLLAQAAPCFIGRNRVAAIKEAEREATHIILDDGLQNPSFVPTKTIMVVDGAVGFGNEHLIPAGPLRERFQDALPRVDAVVIIGDDAQGLSKRLEKPIFRAHLKPQLPPDMSGKDVLAFAGIGRPEKFYKSCRESGLSVVQTRDFADHHVFSFKELQDLEVTAATKGLHLITTAKDFVRLPELFATNVSVLGVQLAFDHEDEVKTFLEG